jgi:hypothetical protein
MKILLAFAFALFAVSAHAAADTTFDSAVRVPEPATNVTIVKSSAPMIGLNISSTPATSVIVDRTQMFRWVEVQNLDSTDSLFCGPNSNVSTGTVSGTGWVIPRSSGTPVNFQSKLFPVVPGGDFFCRNGSESRATRAIIFRGR